MKHFALALLLAGCSSPDDDIDCSTEDLDGLYYVDWERLDGNCGGLVDGLDTLSLSGDPSCTTTVSKNDCRYTETATCVDPSGSYAQVTDQLDSNGDSLKGTLTIRIDGGCSGTWGFTASRQ